MDNFFKVFNSRARASRSGQILVEVIIASLVMVGVSLAIVQVINSSLRAARDSISRSPAVFLGEETLEALRVVAREDWHTLSDLATGSLNLYHPAISVGKWIILAGNENLNLNNSTYTRAFYLEEVYRSTSTGGIVSSGGYPDPSTVRAAIQLSWTDPLGVLRELQESGYFSRFLNKTYSQTDWSGGAAGEVVVTGATSNFATSTDIDFTSEAGSLKLLTQ